MTNYRAKFSIGDFAGYCLWCVQIKPEGRDRYAGGPFVAGRTDTRLQACGLVGRVLEGFPVEAVRDDEAQSWPKIRARIRRPGDKKRFSEGLSWWKAWEGDRAELETEGGAFLARQGGKPENATTGRLGRLGGGIDATHTLSSRLIESGIT